MRGYVNLYLTIIHLSLLQSNSLSSVITLPLVNNCYEGLTNSLDFHSLSKSIVPSLEGTRKGDNGRIAIVGGSIHYGGPYFAAMSALKVGADKIRIITTPDAAPIIKSYNPEFVVYPFLNYAQDDLEKILKKIDTVVIGPGLGKTSQDLESFKTIVSVCRRLKKPLVIDAHGLYALSMNVTILSGYQSAILTPNYREEEYLKAAVQEETNQGSWYDYWGPGVTVLTKGAEDQFHSSFNWLSWKRSEGGSGRRTGGQGDILAGALGTFYNWALKSDIYICDSANVVIQHQLKQAVASSAAAMITRKTNELAFARHGRSMDASDMLKEIHPAFEELFESQLLKSRSRDNH